MSHRAQAERQERRRLEILSTQVRLLYANADLGVCVTVLAATVVSGLQWGLISTVTIAGWWTYMALVSTVRYALARRFQHAAPHPGEIADGAPLTQFVSAWLGSVGAEPGSSYIRRPASQIRYSSFSSWAA